MGVRLGIVFGAAGLGLAACALALVPLALRGHHRVVSMPVFHGTTSIVAVPVDGSPPRQVLRLRGQYDFPTDTADGRALLVEKSVGSARPVLWRFPLAGGAPSRVGVFPVLQQPQWSPDRSRVLLVGTQNGYGMYRLDGTRLRTFTTSHGIGGIGCGPWAGDFIACVRETRPASGWHLELEVRHADGRLAWHRPIPFPMATAAVAPDGRRVVLSRVTSTELVTPTTRRTLAMSPLHGLPSLAWTPDGKSLVFVDRLGRLSVRNMQTGATRILTRDLGEFSVSHDGRTVYVAGMKHAVNIPK